MDEQDEILDRTILLGQWRSIVIGTCTTDGCLELWLNTPRNELLDHYARAALASICQSIKAGLAHWADGTGDADNAAAELADAQITITELAELVVGHPLAKFLQLGSDAITAVAWDTAAGIITDEEPF